MKPTSLTIALLTNLLISVCPTFSAEPEGRPQDKIEKITPVSEEIPVTIKTIRYDVDMKVESETVTEGMRRKYQYDIEYNSSTRRHRLAYNANWFLSIGLNGSDPNDEQYGIWFDSSDIDRCTLHIFSPQEQYIFIMASNSVWIGNICNPIDKIQELEKRINTSSWYRPGYVLSFGDWMLDRHTGKHRNKILQDEIVESEQIARLVSFTKTPEGGFSLTVESPKSKSLFVFVTDKEWTDQALETYNRLNEEKLETAPPRMVRWKLLEFKQSDVIILPKEFRHWLIRDEHGVDTREAKYVSNDDKTVTLETRDGQRITITLSQLHWDVASQNYIRFVLTVEAGGEETETIRSLDFRLPPSRE